MCSPFKGIFLVLHESKIAFQSPYIWVKEILDEEAKLLYEHRALAIIMYSVTRRFIALANAMSWEVLASVDSLYCCVN